MNDNEERPVTIIIGRVWRARAASRTGVHVMLVAPGRGYAPCAVRSKR